LIGAAVAKAGTGALISSGLIKTISFIVLSPLLGFLFGSMMMLLVSWLFVRSTPQRSDRWFRRMQFISASMYSLGHGGNDAQKTMGIIWMLLIAAGFSAASDPLPWWVIISCYAAICALQVLFDELLPLFAWLDAAHGGLGWDSATLGSVQTFSGATQIASGLLLVPALFWWISTQLGNAGSLPWIKAGIFLAGLFTVAQFSFWGNYIPLVFPTHLRGTGESFAANIGGRVLGTAAAWLTLTFSAATPPDPVRIAVVGAVVAGLYALVGVILTQWLPEPDSSLEH
jgi:uncharacterized membrane protein YbaN (DUF454 family)